MAQEKTLAPFCLYTRKKKKRYGLCPKENASVALNSENATMIFLIAEKREEKTSNSFEEKEQTTMTNTTPPFATLDAWLHFVENLHSTSIDLGLDRMKAMVERMGIAFSCPVITVAGTNGKGSTVTMLRAIYRAAGYRTGVHTSPHLIRFNERARIDGQEISDERMLEALAEVEAKREGTLSYFEYTGLAILRAFQKQNLDVVILEIGLGGRLDAMNTIDSQAAIVTTVNMDHRAFLGNDRAKIGWEKAHVYRKGCRAVCSDPTVPASVPEYAARIGAQYRQSQKDFFFRIHDDGTWSWRGDRHEWSLPAPGLVGLNQYQNAAGVLSIIEGLRTCLPVTEKAIVRGLQNAKITGRFELMQRGRVRVVFDVGHNPEAAQVLAKNIAHTKRDGERTLAVFGMLADKDMKGVVEALRDSFDSWFIASLTGPRAATAQALRSAMLDAGVRAEAIEMFPRISEALAQARFVAKNYAEHGDRPVRIIVFGSFVTVTAALHAWHAHP